MKPILIAMSSLMIFFSVGSGAAQCLDYEPKTVTLSGTIIRQTHPGPPNYESIRRGDKPETIWVLRLGKAICVLASDDFNVGENNQKEVQLVLEPEQYKKYHKLLGQRVNVSGKLLHAHTGHHHKQLLLTTSAIRKTTRDSR